MPRNLGRVLWAPFAALLGYVIEIADIGQIALRTSLTSLEGAWVPAINDEPEEIWTRMKARLPFLGERNADFLHWRFGEMPGNAYQLFLVRDTNRVPIAYFICRYQLDTVDVQDWLACGSAGERLLAVMLLARASRNLGAEKLTIEMAAPTQLMMTLRNGLFVARDRRSLFIMAGDNAPPLSNDSIYLTRADEDI